MEQNMRKFETKQEKEKKLKVREFETKPVIEET
jgi:hypothetical protein